MTTLKMAEKSETCIRQIINVLVIHECVLDWLYYLILQFYFNLSTGAVFLAMLTNWHLQVLGSRLWEAP